MTVYDLDKQVTPGPLLFRPLLSGEIVLTDMDGFGVLAALPGRQAGNGYPAEQHARRVEAQYALHCRNKFLTALTALKEEHSALIAEADTEHLMGDCPTCKLIQELEKV